MLGWMLVLLGAFVIGLIWAIVVQVKQSKKEDFEQRDN